MSWTTDKQAMEGVIDHNIDMMQTMGKPWCPLSMSVVRRLVDFPTESQPQGAAAHAVGNLIEFVN